MDFNTIDTLNKELQHEKETDPHVKVLLNKLSKILQNKSYCTPSDNKHPKNEDDLLNPESVRLDDLASLFDYHSYL